MVCLLKNRGRNKRGQCWHWLADPVVATLHYPLHLCVADGPLGETGFVFVLVYCR